MIDDTVGLRVAAAYVYPPDKVDAPPPLSRVTVTSVAPAAPAGTTAVIVVGLTSATQIAATPPTATEGFPAAPKLVPVMVIRAPPSIGPLVGETLLTVGDGAYS